MCKSSSQECCQKHFSLECNKPDLFVNPQWHIPQGIYFIWRLVVAIFFTVWIIMSGFGDICEPSLPHGEKWFIYLTNWGFFLLTVETLIEVLTVGMALRKGGLFKGKCSRQFFCQNSSENTAKPDRKSSTQEAGGNAKSNGDEGNQEEMPWLYKMSWVMYNVATPLGLAITVGYLTIYVIDHAAHTDGQGDDLTPATGDPYTCVGYVTHGVNSIYILVNLFITAIPVRIQHFWHCMVLSVVYIPFSVIYEKSGGTSTKGYPYIYKQLDWDKSLTPLYAILLGTVVPIVSWLIVYSLYVIRIVIFKKCDCEFNNPEYDKLEYCP